MLRLLTRFFAKKRVKDTPYFPVSSANDLLKIRNVGVVAHIDAGKTTVTERMLYYCGALPTPGNVDDGTTVMDYMEQERARGITIRSAAITFTWNQFHFNLIDTPGHVDFSGEVERALRVMDGGVVVMDSSRGVQPQTETVWTQSNKHGVPRIVFANKMDLKGASLELCLSDLSLQIPIGYESSYSGNIDLISMQAVTFADKLGNTVDITPLTPDYSNKRLYEEAVKRRETLIEQVASLDDTFAELYLSGKHTDQDLKLAIRNLTINMRAFPVYCGTALRNKGIQMLLDGIVDYLASPAETPAVHAVTRDGEAVTRSASDKPLCAFAFKVMANTEKGPLVYLRLYSGKLKQGQFLKNITRGGIYEKAQRLFRVRAKEYVEVEEVTGGDVIAVMGLSKAFSGDTLLDKSDTKEFLLPGVAMPPPVFFCSISADSEMQQKKLEDILIGLCREDPSLICQNNEESGQLVVMGLGELHLEILRDRLFIEFGVKARLGQVRVAYRETAKRMITHTLLIDRPAEKEYFSIKIRLEPMLQEQDVTRARLQDLMEKGASLDSTTKWSLVDPKHSLYSDIQKQIDSHRSSRSHLVYENEDILPIHKITKEMRDDMIRCIDDSLRRGIILGYPLINISVVVEDGLWYKSRYSRALLAEACSKVVPEALKKADPIVLEPIMTVEIVVPDVCMGDALNDIAATRRGLVLETKKDVTGEKNIILARIPLVELIGYSTALRSISKGEGTFTMEFESYRELDSEGLAQLRESGF